MPDVIKNGTVYYPEGKIGVERIVVAAPVTIGTKPAYVGVMLQRDLQSQRMYLHDVVRENEQGMLPQTQTRPDASGVQVSRGQARLDISTILLKALEVKTDYSLSDREQLDKWIEQYGAIPAGEKPTRDIPMPVRTEASKKLSQTVRTVLEARVTPDTEVPTIENLTTKGVYSYTPYADKAAIAHANGKPWGCGTKEPSSMTDEADHRRERTIPE